ncbi:MAG: hypothetical protein D6815_11565 [Candidatus Dadabacteria bacterium]|nr:MAG: hypothetical protein D6815_11565 [Candidatus Dadabacteria bacterium]
MTIASFPAAFEVIRAMRVDGPEWSDRPGAGGEALRHLLQGQMHKAVDRPPLDLKIHASRLVDA